MPRRCTNAASVTSQLPRPHKVHKVAVHHGGKAHPAVAGPDPPAHIGTPGPREAGAPMLPWITVQMSSQRCAATAAWNSRHTSLSVQAWSVRKNASSAPGHSASSVRPASPARAMRAMRQQRGGSSREGEITMSHHLPLGEAEPQPGAVLWRGSCARTRRKIVKSGS